MEWEWWSQWLMRSLLKRPQPTALRAEQGPLLGKGWSSIQMWPFREGEPGGRVGAEREKSHPSGLMTSTERSPVQEQEPGSGPYVVSRTCLRGNCLGFVGLVMSLWQVLPAGPDAHPWQWTDSPLTPDSPPLLLRPFPTPAHRPLLLHSHNWPGGQPPWDLQVRGTIVINSLGAGKGGKKRRNSLVIISENTTWLISSCRTQFLK